MPTWRHCHLALQDESFVRELQLCVKQKNEILQKDLADDVAARSAKLYYYLTQSLSRWERGQELLRSCSKRQSLSACGCEAVRTITQQYSIVSRMEAVYVRSSASSWRLRASITDGRQTSSVTWRTSFLVPNPSLGTFQSCVSRRLTAAVFCCKL